MATTAIDLHGVTAALGYQYDGATRFLTRPDPKNTPIRFTLQATTESAIFDIVVPIKYKAKTSSNSINIRISPLSITSLEHSTKTDLPEQVKQIFSPALCLEMQLRDTATILVPSLLDEPVQVARRQSGLVLNSLYELSHTTNLFIYILDSSLSSDQLQSISTAVAQRQLGPFAGPDHDVSRMFSGTGAKPTTLPAPLPPSYDKVASTGSNPPLYNEFLTFDPPATRSRKRKPSQDAVADSNTVWNKLEKLEVMFNRQREQDTHAAKQSLVIQELRAEVAELGKKLETCQKQCEDFEAQVAGLQEAQAIADDNETLELAELRYDISNLETRIDFVERGKDDDEFCKRIKEEISNDIFDEMAARVKGG
ncbi:hypothetical protein ACHAPU_011474 [Fusarium lateritium]